ncbi:TRAP transporter large permease [Ferrovibrio sp.]|uniref:TRAP transporter large permease n=1 Tax=Ferrovibrio sp. TaxID=1917215 RepID=UPI0035146F16
MSGFSIGILFILVMIVMMVIRVPIAIAMLLSGAAGYIVLAGWLPLLSQLKTGPFYLLSSESFSVIPLFLLMGYIASRSGISRSLFAGANAFLGHVRGGLSMAAIGACAMFGAICGSSLATAATMGQVALPEMKRYGYAGGHATAALAAGGTLGILIPPSIPLIVYCILAEQNIAKLFFAAFLPGILATIGYMIAIAVYARINPSAAPAGARSSWSERAAAIRNMVPILLLFVLVLGGIYTGIFTPTEAAAFGTLGSLLIAMGLNGMRLRALLDCLRDTAVSTGMIFMILIGAETFNSFMALSGVPQVLADTIGSSGLSPMVILILILLVYLVLGCLMDSLSMIILTLPIFLPAVMSLDFGLTAEQTAIWFGILVLIVVEVGLITPPVGMNVFVINKLARDVPMRQTFRGVVPFLISDVVRVGFLVAFPPLTYGLLTLVNW